MSSSTMFEEVSVVEFDFNDTEPDLNFPSIQQYLSSDANLSLNAALDALTLSDNKKGKQKQKKGGAGAGGADNNNDGAELEPIVISTSITTQYVKELHELLQSPSYSPYSIASDWIYTDAETENGLPGFTVQVRLKSKVNDAVIKEFAPDRCFPTKKLAKEVSAGVALEYLKELPDEVAQLPKAESSDAGSMRSDDPQESVNWVGMLQDFCQQRGALPLYTFFQPSKVHQQFSCEITGVPSVQTKVFGSKAMYYRNKKIAKVQAAKAAMLYLNENPQPIPPKSPKGKAGSNKSVGKAPPGSIIKVPATIGVVEKVSRICPQLGLSLPDYAFYQDANAPSLFDVSAIVRRGGDKKDARFGRLRGKLGKKNAKEHMAAAIFRWLHTEAAANQVTIELEGS